MSASRLSILHTNFHRGWGGQPSRILMVSRRLAERGHDVVIGTPAGSILSRRSRELGLETFERCRYPKMKRPPRVLWDALKMHSYLKTRRFDLIDAHGSQDLWVVSLARAIGRWNMPLIFTRHNTKRLKDNLPNRLVYRRIDHLIVVTSTILERYEPYFERGDLDRRQVSVVHSSYWEERFHGGVDGSAVRSEILRDGEDLLVGVVGRLVPDKGGIYFLRAAAELSARRAGIRFVFAGVGDDEPHLKQAAQELGIAAHVDFLGFREDVPQVVAALDLLVLPSVDCDASSAAIKEAMAVGRPVVATRVGGAAEILREGETGLLVPARDPGAMAAAIDTILSREDRGRALGARGQERVKAFGQDRLTDGTLGAYHRALAIRAAAPGEEPGDVTARRAS